MKKVIFTLFSLCILYVSSNAQYCGNSGPSVCTAEVLSKPGLSPLPDSLCPVLNGSTCTTIIHFQNYDTINFGGSLLTVQSLGIDSITNLPSGLCWATNKANNTWGNKENGCIAVSGTCCSAPGQYRLGIYVAANVGFTIHTNAAAAGLSYYVRVNNVGDPIRPIDTTGQAANNDATKFKSYNETANCAATSCASSCDITGIREVTSNITSMNIVPNPFNNKAVVSFYSDKAMVMTERLSNMLGETVSMKNIEVRMGENSSVIEKNNLPAGIYFYSLSNGRNIMTKRLIISE